MDPPPSEIDAAQVHLPQGNAGTKRRRSRSPPGATPKRPRGHLPTPPPSGIKGNVNSRRPRSRGPNLSLDLTISSSTKHRNILSSRPPWIVSLSKSFHCNTQAGSAIGALVSGVSLGPLPEEMMLEEDVDAEMELALYTDEDVEMAASLAVSKPVSPQHTQPGSDETGLRRKDVQSVGTTNAEVDEDENDADVVRGMVEPLGVEEEEYRIVVGNRESTKSGAGDAGSQAAAEPLHIPRTVSINRIGPNVEDSDHKLDDSGQEEGGEHEGLSTYAAGCGVRKMEVLEEGRNPESLNDADPAGQGFAGGMITGDRNRDPARDDEEEGDGVARATFINDIRSSDQDSDIGEQVSRSGSVGMVGSDDEHGDIGLDGDRRYTRRISVEDNEDDNACSISTNAIDSGDEHDAVSQSSTVDAVGSDNEWDWNEGTSLMGGRGGHDFDEGEGISRSSSVNMVGSDDEYEGEGGYGPYTVGGEVGLTPINAANSGDKHDEGEQFLRSRYVGAVGSDGQHKPNTVAHALEDADKENLERVSQSSSVDVVGSDGERGDLGVDGSEHHTGRISTNTVNGDEVNTIKFGDEQHEGKQVSRSSSVNVVGSNDEGEQDQGAGGDEENVSQSNPLDRTGLDCERGVFRIGLTSVNLVDSTNENGAEDRGFRSTPIEGEAMKVEDVCSSDGQNDDGAQVNGSREGELGADFMDEEEVCVEVFWRGSVDMVGLDGDGDGERGGGVGADAMDEDEDQISRSSSIAMAASAVGCKRIEESEWLDRMLDSRDKEAGLRSGSVEMVPSDNEHNIDVNVAYPVDDGEHHILNLVESNNVDNGDAQVYRSRSIEMVGSDVEGGQDAGMDIRRDESAHGREGQGVYAMDDEEDIGSANKHCNPVGGGLEVARSSSVDMVGSDGECEGDTMYLTVLRSPSTDGVGSDRSDGGGEAEEAGEEKDLDTDDRYPDWEARVSISSSVGMVGSYGECKGDAMNDADSLPFGTKHDEDETRSLLAVLRSPSSDGVGSDGGSEFQGEGVDAMGDEEDLDTVLRSPSFDGVGSDGGREGDGFGAIGDQEDLETDNEYLDWEGMSGSSSVNMVGSDRASEGDAMNHDSLPFSTEHDEDETPSLLAVLRSPSSDGVGSDGGSEFEGEGVGVMGEEEDLGADNEYFDWEGASGLSSVNMVGSDGESEGNTMNDDNSLPFNTEHDEDVETRSFLAGSRSRLSDGVGLDGGSEFEGEGVGAMGDEEDLDTNDEYHDWEGMSGSSSVDIDDDDYLPSETEHDKGTETRSYLAVSRSPTTDVVGSDQGDQVDAMDNKEDIGSDIDLDYSTERVAKSSSVGMVGSDAEFEGDAMDSEEGTGYNEDYDPDSEDVFRSNSVDMVGSESEGDADDEEDGLTVPRSSPVHQAALVVARSNSVDLVGSDTETEEDGALLVSRSASVDVVGSDSGFCESEGEQSRVVIATPTKVRQRQDRRTKTGYRLPPKHPKSRAMNRSLSPPSATSQLFSQTYNNQDPYDGDKTIEPADHDSEDDEDAPLHVAHSPPGDIGSDNSADDTPPARSPSRGGSVRRSPSKSSTGSLNLGSSWSCPDPLINQFYAEHENDAEPVTGKKFAQLTRILYTSFPPSSGTGSPRRHTRRSRSTDAESDAEDGESTAEGRYTSKDTNPKNIRKERDPVHKAISNFVRPLTFKLMGRTRDAHGESPIQTVTTSRIIAFFTHKREDLGPSTEYFQAFFAMDGLDAGTRKLCNAWNKRVADVFVPEFIKEHPDYVEERIKIRSCFEAHLKYLKIRFKSQHVEQLDDEEAKLRRIAKVQLRRSRCERRLLTMESYSTVPALVHLAKKMKTFLDWKCCSGDETDSGGEQTITDLPWRARPVRDFMRNIDHLYLLLRFPNSSNPTQGRFPQFRYDPSTCEPPRQMDVDRIQSTYVPGLPLNFYDRDWLASLGPLERGVLNALDPIDLSLPDPVLELAETALTVKGRNTRPLPRPFDL